MQEWTDVWFWLSPMQSCHITSRFFTLLVYRRWLHPQKQMLNKKARNIYIYIYIFKYIEIFFSIEMSGSKIDPQWIFLMEELLKSIYIYMLLEWGGSLCHLHLQMVCKLHISSLTLNQAVKCQFGWMIWWKLLWSRSWLQTFGRSRFVYLCWADRISFEACRRGALQSYWC